MNANPAAPITLEPYILDFPTIPNEKILAVKIHQITHVSTAQIIQTAKRLFKTAGLLSFPPAMTHANASREILRAPHMGCAKPHSKEFPLISRVTCAEY